MAAYGMICPLCGKSIWYDEKLTELYCTYCGTKLFLEDGTVLYEESNSREVRRTQEQLAARTEQDIRTKRRNWIIMVLLWSVISGITLAAIMPKKSERLSNIALMILLLGAVICGANFPGLSQSPPRPPSVLEKWLAGSGAVFASVFAAYLAAILMR